MICTVTFTSRTRCSSRARSRPSAARDTAMRAMTEVQRRPMSTTMATPAVPWRKVLVPAEHGAWGFLAEPLLLGLVGRVLVAGARAGGGGRRGLPRAAHAQASARRSAAQESATRAPKWPSARCSCWARSRWRESWRRSRSRGLGCSSRWRSRCPRRRSRSPTIFAIAGGCGSRSWRRRSLGGLRAGHRSGARMVARSRARAVGGARRARSALDPLRPRAVAIGARAAGGVGRVRGRAGRGAPWRGVARRRRASCRGSRWRRSRSWPDAPSWGSPRCASR